MVGLIAAQDITYPLAVIGCCPTTEFGRPLRLGGIGCRLTLRGRVSVVWSCPQSVLVADLGSVVGRERPTLLLGSAFNSLLTATARRTPLVAALRP